MKCPTDDSTLTMSERSGIEIDYCPQCRGVWLDRGELDKILDRSAGVAAPTASTDTAAMPAVTSQQAHDHGQRPVAATRRKRKESWLSELVE